jgi:hypothetical protein
MKNWMEKVLVRHRRKWQNIFKWTLKRRGVVRNHWFKIRSNFGLSLTQYLILGFVRPSAPQKGPICVCVWEEGRLVQNFLNCDLKTILLKNYLYSMCQFSKPYHFTILLLWKSKVVSVINELSTVPWRRMGEWKYSSALDGGISSQLNAPDALLQWKEQKLPIGYEVGWAPQPVWTLWRRENLNLVENRTLAVQPLARHYTDWAIPASLRGKINKWREERA